MFKVPIDIPAETYELIQNFLETGVIRKEGNVVDFSPVQEVRISDGKVTFNPPANVSINVGPISVKTTLTTLRVKPGGIKVNIDNSPIDVEVRPSE